ncbi:MAG TPA: DUF2270 domain-containing protein [Xanthobacteraceae bacterium]|jgi:uncharacterized membrane protein
MPKTPSEHITLIAHYYRAEMARMSGWRDRIDRTTNWAITVAGAMLSVSLSTSTAHHGVLLFAMILVLLLLVIESRRYRFFDVYRARVRLLERQYFARIFSAGGESDPEWTRVLSDDLKKPVFLMSYGLAFSRRLRRNYVWMFLILLLAWLLKISTPKLMPDGTPGHFAHSVSEWAVGAGIGPVPGGVVVLAVAAFYGCILYAALRRDPGEGELAIGEVHV